MRFDPSHWRCDFHVVPDCPGYRRLANKRPTLRTDRKHLIFRRASARSIRVSFSDNWGKSDELMNLSKTLVELGQELILVELAVIALERLAMRAFGGVGGRQKYWLI